MTDGTNGMSQSIDTSSSQTVTSSQPPVQSNAPATQDERTFRQQEVSEIVKRAKHDAVESYRKMQTEQPQYLQQKYGDANVAQPSNFGEEHYRKIAAEEAQKHLDGVRKEALQKSQDEHAQRTVDNFFNKISAGKEKYKDFDSVTGDVELARFPNVVQLMADHVDNAGDVYYELTKDRTKMAMLEQLALMSPKDAIVQARRLSQSIKDNEAASKIRTPNEPLSQLRPSNTGTDNGAMSVKDYRKKYKV